MSVSSLSAPAPLWAAWKHRWGLCEVSTPEVPYQESPAAPRSDAPGWQHQPLRAKRSVLCQTSSFPQ